MGTATWEPCRGASPVDADNRRLTASTIQNEKRWCVIDKMTEKEDTGNATVKKRPASGKTRIIVKEHFSEQGKTIDELWTDVLLEKAKQTTAWEKGAEMRTDRNTAQYHDWENPYPCAGNRWQWRKDTGNRDILSLYRKNWLKIGLIFLTKGNRDFQPRGLMGNWYKFRRLSLKKIECFSKIYCVDN